MHDFGTKRVMNCLIFLMHPSSINVSYAFLFVIKKVHNKKIVLILRCTTNLYFLKPPVQTEDVLMD